MSGGGKDIESGWILFFATVLIIFMTIFLWYIFRQPILEGLRYLRLGEAWIATLFASEHMSYCRAWLQHARLDDKDPPLQIMQWAQGCFGDNKLQQYPNPLVLYGLTGYSIIAVEEAIAPYFRWIALAAFGGLFTYLLFFSNHTKFRRVHTLESFIDVQAKMWPVIAPIVKFNPMKSSARVPGEKMPDKIPLFAEAMSPEEWVSWHRIEVVNNIPDREATRRAFSIQLGPRWTGIADAPPYVQALYAAFALKGVQRREESDDLLGELSLHWTDKGGFVMPAKLAARVKALIKDPDVGGKADEIAGQHAYRTTAMLAVLKWARWMGGVLAPAQFLWLRGVDRNLWYPLNNLGRRSFHTEGAGAMAHFMAEQNAKKALPIARLDTAIITLNQYFNPPDRPAPTVPPREGDKKAQARS